MEYFHEGDRQNGTYTIRPNINYHAFEVECEFTNTGGHTIIKPKQWSDKSFVFAENQKERCTDPN